jgi:DNA gyrase subunit A
MGPAAKGKAIVNLLDLEQEEKLATTVAVREFPEDRFLVFATERGIVKKTPLAAFARPLARGIIAIRVEEGDRLLRVRVADPEQHVLLATAKGYAVRFPESATRSMGRVARGVRGIRLRRGDRVVAMETLVPEGDLLTIAERGFGKRTALDEYRITNRGGLGVINLKVSEKTGEVVAVKQVSAEDEVILISQNGKIIRTPVADFRVIGRSTQGVTVMDLEGEDRVVAAAKLADGGGDEEESDGAENGDTEAPAAKGEEPVN